ncbi:MAG: hypothetical protein L3K09_08765 [Thermoplasmata archaeon]|nr:hypothetical protein [Thermoplasmata archaeon]
MRVPALETERLRIRPLESSDLDAVHPLLDVDLPAGEATTEPAATRDERRRCLEWTVLSYEQELVKERQGI